MLIFSDVRDNQIGMIGMISSVGSLIRNW